MKNDNPSNVSLFKIQYNPCSDIWVDVFGTSNLRQFEDMYSHLKTVHENASFRCLILFGDIYREILI